jgi:hypothetical protein
MSFDPLALAGAKSKGKRPYFLRDPDVERALAITMAVAQELSVMRERMDTIERLLDVKGVVTRHDIEHFAPTKSQAEERGAWTQEYIARILRVVQQENEALETPGDQTSEEIAEELARV